MPHNGVSRKGFGSVFVAPAGPPPVSPRRHNGIDMVSLGPASLLNHPEVPVYTSFTNHTKAYRVTPSLYKKPRYPSEIRPLAVAREEQEDLAGTMTRTMPDVPPSPRQFPEPIQLPQLSIPMSDRGVHALVDFMASASNSPSTSPRSQREPSPLDDLTRGGGGSVTVPTASGVALEATPRRTGKRHLVVHVQRHPNDLATSSPAVAPSRHFRLASFADQQLDAPQ